MIFLDVTPMHLSDQEDTLVLWLLETDRTRLGLVQKGRKGAPGSVSAAEADEGIQLNWNKGGRQLSISWSQPQTIGQE